MFTEIPREDLYQMVRGRGASDNEFEAVWMALNGKPNAQIASEIGITDIAVRKRLGEVYRKFAIEGRGPGKLGELKQILLGEYQRHAVGGREPHDLREAPQVPAPFYGRAQSLKCLEAWILEENCRLVALFGMTAMGKTALVRYFVERVRDRFESIVWRAISTPIAIDDLLNVLLAQFSPDRPVPSNTEDKIERIIQDFDRHRCLLVLDGIELLLEPKDDEHNYKKSYDGYKYFFNQVGQEKHQSCLILTSQEKPKGFQLLERKVAAVRSMELDKLSEADARQLLSGEPLTAPQAWDELIRIYNQTPLTLKRIARIIKELFNGDVESFLEATPDTIVLDHLDRELLEQQYERLPDCEQSILLYLKDRNEPVLSSEILKSLSSKYAISKLTESVQSLKDRDGFLEVSEQPEIAFALNPIFKKIVTLKHS